MATLGNWRWNNNVENVALFDEDQNFLDSINVYIQDVHVGDAAQTKFFIGVSYEIIPDLKVGFDIYHFDNVFASFDPVDRDTKIEGGNPDSWKLPDYQLIDASVTYDFDISDMNAMFYAKFNNIMDTEYISEAEDGNDHSWESARVYYGWGRNWSIGLKMFF